MALTGIFVLLFASFLQSAFASPQVGTKVGGSSSTNGDVQNKFFFNSLPNCDDAANAATTFGTDVATEILAENIATQAGNLFSGLFGRKKRSPLPKGIEVRIIRSANPQGEQTQTRIFCSTASSSTGGGSTGGGGSGGSVNYCSGYYYSRCCRSGGRSRGRSRGRGHYYSYCRQCVC